MTDGSNKAARISIVIERWDHAGDEHSHKAWIEDERVRLTMTADLEQARRYVRALRFVSVDDDDDERGACPHCGAPNMDYRTKRVDVDEHEITVCAACGEHVEL